MKQAIKGFVLSELVIALAVIVIVLAVFAQIFNTNRTKAEILHEKLTDVSASLLRMKTDVACFPRKLSGMVNPSDGSDTFCGPTNAELWRGPYAPVGTTFVTIGSNLKDMQLEQLIPGLEVFLERHVISASTNGSGPSNEKVAWILSTRGLTSEMQTLFLDACTKPISGIPQPKSRCFAELDNQVGYLVDSSEGWEQYYNAHIIPTVDPESCKGANCGKVLLPNPTTNVPTYCTVGVDPGCVPPPPPPPPPCVYGVDPACMPPPPPPPPPPVCIVGVDPKCTPTTSSSGSTSSSSGGSSSSSSGSMAGYRGSDGQLYSSPLSKPGEDQPCGGGCRDAGETNESRDARNGSDSATSGLSSAFSSFASFVSSLFSSSPSDTGGNNSSSGGGNPNPGGGGMDTSPGSGFNSGSWGGGGSNTGSSDSSGTSGTGG